MADIEARLQLALTLGIFFPAALYSFFKFVGEQEQSASHIFLQASSLIVFYILNYVSFELVKHRLNEQRLLRLNVIALTCVASFVVPVIFTVYSGATMPLWLSYLLKAALIGQSIVSVLPLLAIAVFTIRAEQRHSQ